MRETRAGGQEHQYSAIKTTEQWRKNTKGHNELHSAQMLLQRGKVPGQNMADPSLKTAVFEKSKKLCSLLPVELIKIDIETQISVV